MSGALKRAPANFERVVRPLDDPGDGLIPGSLPGLENLYRSGERLERAHAGVHRAPSGQMTVLPVKITADRSASMS